MFSVTFHNSSLKCSLLMWGVTVMNFTASKAKYWPFLCLQMYVFCDQAVLLSRISVPRENQWLVNI